MYQCGIRAKGPGLKSFGQHLTIFFLFKPPHFDHRLSPNLNISFLFLSFENSLSWSRGYGFEPLQPRLFFYLFIFLGYLELTMRLWDQTPTT